MGLNYDLPRIGIIDPRGQFLKYHFSQELKFENIKVKVFIIYISIKIGIHKLI
jgi:hypothetical protein